MGPLENISKDDLKYWIASLASDNAYKPDPTPPDMSECLFAFLQSKQGPHLSLCTMWWLSDIGISNGTEFFNFARQSFSDMFSSLSDQHFSSLTTKGLPHIMVCGLYLWENELVPNDGHIHTRGFDPTHYHAFQHQHCKSIQKTFNDAYLQELELHVHIACEGRHFLDASSENLRHQPLKCNVQTILIPP